MSKQYRFSISKINVEYFKMFCRSKNLSWPWKAISALINSNANVKSNCKLTNHHHYYYTFNFMCVVNKLYSQKFWINIINAAERVITVVFVRQKLPQKVVCRFYEPNEHERKSSLRNFTRQIFVFSFDFLFFSFDIFQIISTNELLLCACLQKSLA